MNAVEGLKLAGMEQVIQTVATKIAEDVIKDKEIGPLVGGSGK